MRRRCAGRIRVPLPPVEAFWLFTRGERGSGHRAGIPCSLFLVRTMLSRAPSS